MDVATELMKGDKAHPIYDPLWPLQPGDTVPGTLEMYVWHNHSSKKLRGVMVLLHLKCEMCGALEEAIWDW